MNYFHTNIDNVKCIISSLLDIDIKGKLKLKGDVKKESFKRPYHYARHTIDEVRVN